MSLSLRTFWCQVQFGHPLQQLQHMVRAQLGNKLTTGYALHPCLINHQQTLVYSPDLPGRDPIFFSQLQEFAGQHGYQLLSDRRREDQVVSYERRKRSIPVLLLSMGLGTASAVADPSVPASQTLALFDSQLESMHQHDTVALPPMEFRVDSEESIGQAVLDEEHVAVAAELASILQQHYLSEGDEPDYLKEDLLAMADYFARYPQATALLRSLQGHAWQMHYVKDRFETQVRGNRLQVQGVTIAFDTRAAAQLRNHRACETNPGACIASPADALLHELLHAQSALLDPQEFIAQGGLNSVIYPFEHESVVIHKENALYQAMSEVDGRYRPSRHVHAGRIVASACVTCLN